MERELASILKHFLVFIFLSPLSAFANGITYHGRILKSDNSPLSSAAARFRIQIRSPGPENCLLWEEEQTKDLSSTNGVFSINITDSADMTVNYSRTDGYLWSMERVFSNKSLFSGLTDCAPTFSSYTPALTDARKIKVSFKENITDPT